MTRSVRVSPSASRDIEAHSEYIAAGNSRAAAAFPLAVAHEAQKLADMPGMGALVCSANTMLDLRTWRLRRFSNHLIVYRQTPEGIEVLRVLHASQDWLAMIDA